MRNLKRALSLALASVMLLGMMVVGAGAASYPDVDNNDNVEAIQVLNAVKVMLGDEKGNFRPDDKVNRYEMAVITAKLLLGVEEADKYTGSHPFTDIPADHYASKYVAACYEYGVISGTSATTYSGGQPLTATQAALIMMRALGYEYLTRNASDWRAPVVKQAQKIQLFKDAASSPNAQMTRNQVAQLALNALESDVVVTVDDKFTVTADNVTVDIGLPDYDQIPLRTETVTSNYDQRTPAATGTSGTQQLCEKLYGTDLVVKNGTPDDFGRPVAREWFYKNVSVAAVPANPVAVYNDKATRGTLYSLLGRSAVNKLGSSPDYALADDADWVVYVDGQYLGSENVNDYFASNDSTSIGAAGNAQTGNGSRTEVFKNSKGAVTISVTNTYLLQAVTDYNSSKGTLTVRAVSDGISLTGTNNTLSVDDFAVSGCKADDYLLATVSYLSGSWKVISVTPVDVTTGEVSTYTTNENVTIDGTTYKYAFTANSADKATTYGIGKKAAVVLDGNYVIAVDEATVSSADYVYIHEFGRDGGVGSNFKGDAYFADGTSKVIDVKDVNKADPILGTSARGWYAYSVNSDGKYVLTTSSDAKAYSVLTGSKASETGSVAVADAKGNASTILIVKDKKNNDVTYYTGVANVPTITAGPSGLNVYYVLNDASFVRFAFVEVPNESGATIDDGTDAAGLVYILRTTGNSVNVKDGKQYKIYEAIVDGELVKDLKVEAGTSATPGMLYKKMKTNSDGWVTSMTEVSGSGWSAQAAMTPGTDKVVYNDGTLSIYGGDYTVAKDAEIVLVYTKTTIGLLNDKGANYEYEANISAKQLFDKLKGWKLTGTYYLKTNSDNSNQLEKLYVYVTGTAADNAVVAWEYEADKTYTITYSDPLDLSTFTIDGSPASGDKINLIAVGPKGTKTSGKIELTYNGASWAVTGGTVTVYPVDGSNGTSYTVS